MPQKSLGSATAEPPGIYLYPEAINEKLKNVDIFVTGSSLAGGRGARPPYLKYVPPHFMVGPPGCCIHPILYLENVAPPYFLAPLLRNPGDNPAL